METDKILLHTKALLTYYSVKGMNDFEPIYHTMKELRELSFTSETAKEKLLSLIYSENVHTKIHAAEALSFTKSYPSEVIPVFKTFLDVAREQNKIDDVEGWLRLSLGSIARFEEEAIMAEKNVWEYLYTQSNINLILYAITALAKISKVSTASWTILCLMCRHENETISTFSKDLMNSNDFKHYMTGTDYKFPLN